MFTRFKCHLDWEYSVRQWIEKSKQNKWTKLSNNFSERLAAIFFTCAFQCHLPYKMCIGSQIFWHALEPAYSLAWKLKIFFQLKFVACVSNAFAQTCYTTGGAYFAANSAINCMKKKKKQERWFKVHCIVNTTTANFRMPAKTRRLLCIENNISHNSAVLKSIHTDYNVVTS